ncbi:MULTISPECIES: hypothetical protein [Legionella]|uniref:Dot/Icm T4SS effector n=1 Tax=Legionella resiliens TaxID=2905958 RepID=A0ABS8X775_9GAMM|nr:MULTISPECIES: hypothetical protein [unclassified Legionella]MCE0723781.1 hypothetical protein [Legionella sp. 9fVS26]MCE3532933.1 hypothetical protein [Legionella sp. 8cVS16]
MSSIDINIETLILVTIWDQQPCIFQGCFKISALHSQSEQYFIFRSEVSYSQQTDFIEHEFYPDNYRFTHFYNPEQKICLDEENESQEFALYILNYALYVTIKEMLIKNPQKQQLLSVDDTFLDSLIGKIKPILNNEPLWNESMKEIGFAVAMDFCPKEEMGKTAVQTLLAGFGYQEFKDREIH